METTIVRLTNIHIENFKNVIDGFIDFKPDDSCGSANLLGLYGQNGSGKTALVDAMSLLFFALRGMSVPVQFADFINVGATEATISYSFDIASPGSARVTASTYALSVRKQSLMPGTVNSDARYAALICKEKLSFSVKENGKSVVRLTQLINTDAPQDEPFTSASDKKFSELVGSKSIQSRSSLLAARKVCEAMSRSFIFSRELRTVLRENCSVKEYRYVVESLAVYGSRDLFVFNVHNNAMVTFNILPVSFNIHSEENHDVAGSIAIPFAGNGLVSEAALELVGRIIKNMNAVLSALIPGLAVSCRDLGTELQPNGEKAHRIQLISEKDGKSIPLCYESEGIKKIVAILQLLIIAFNNPSSTVVIDDLDSCVFEYLLGELLRVIAESGKGQLIFTSHNLRPLETIDKRFIAFTTTNPENRYIRLINVKTTNNLRDLYYRNITLCDQSEQVYEQTNTHDILLAFKEAEKYCYP